MRWFQISTSFCDYNVLARGVILGPQPRCHTSGNERSRNQEPQGPRNGRKFNEASPQDIETVNPTDPNGQRACRDTGHVPFQGKVRESDGSKFGLMEV